ncbi:MAG TPA: molybdopterin-dependent oxidoreductase [Ktedonobacteraceae bacterium]|nr:molybdopterin-dependent oxidoreductase [Ktedonobacteraceae bacterium]
MATRISYTTCPLCEATCGLEIETRSQEIISIRGDAQDVFSHGYICPKAYSLKELHTDPDRLRTPLVRKDGRWLAVSWDDAFAEVEHGLMPLLEEYGRDALAIYLGNPNAHNLSSLLYLPALLQSAGTHNVYSASTLDQMPKQITAGLMFGTLLSIPVPDLDHTEYLLLLGANPLVSNGSLMTAPDMRGRLRRLRQRGGKIVVIDPYRTRTAQEADAHHFIRPGYDAYFLFALVHTLFAEGLVAPGRLADHLAGLEQVRTLAEAFAPERVAGVCGIEAATMRSIARELAAAPRAAVYGRIGTCTQAFGTLTSWLVDVLNVLTGNLDREGGAMFPRAAAGARNTSGVPGHGRGVRFGRWKSRVRGLPERFGELPAACLSEEITTPGAGQVKALITLAGNPALSTPGSSRLQQALDTLSYMVSVDIYLNETTRHANVILPPPPALARSHYDIALYQLAVHNVAHYSAPVFEHEPGALDEWEIFLRLAGILTGQGASANPHLLDDFSIAALVQREVATAGSPVEGRDAQELLTELAARRGPERILDFLLRTGPYGDGFSGQDGLSLPKLEKQPHGLDLGPLQPRVPEVLRTPSGKIELAPQPLVEDVERLRASLEQNIARPEGQMLLIGRRDLRSNNSWMHNLHVLTKGKERCVLHIHPQDATRLALAHGESATVTSRAGSIDIPVEITDAIMPGVVSAPHGWGHAQPGTQMDIAATHPGVNTNILSDEGEIDPLSGNAVLNGIPVVVQKAARILQLAHD